MRLNRLRLNRLWRRGLPPSRGSLLQRLHGGVGRGRSLRGLRLANLIDRDRDRFRLDHPSPSGGGLLWRGLWLALTCRGIAVGRLLSLLSLLNLTLAGPLHRRPK